MADLLSLAEGAKELHLSIHTLRSWTYQKRIPFVRLGRRILLRREDLGELVERNVIEAKEEG